MRYLFWNTFRNDDINVYISKLVEENNIDIVMLAEYTADHADLVERLKSQDSNYEETNLVPDPITEILQR